MFLIIHLSVYFRKALFSLQEENRNLKHQLPGAMQPDFKQSNDQKVLDDEEEEEELDVTIEGVGEDGEEKEISELWDTWDGELYLSQPDNQSDGQSKKRLSSSSSEVEGASCSDYAGATPVCECKHLYFCLSCRSAWTASCPPLGSRGLFTCSRRAKSCKSG